MILLLPHLTIPFPCFSLANREIKGRPRLTPNLPDSFHTTDFLHNPFFGKKNRASDDPNLPVGVYIFMAGFTTEMVETGFPTPFLNIYIFFKLRFRILLTVKITRFSRVVKMTSKTIRGTVRNILVWIFRFLVMCLSVSVENE